MGWAELSCAQSCCAQSGCPETGAALRILPREAASECCASCCSAQFRPSLLLKRSYSKENLLLSYIENRGNVHGVNGEFYRLNFQDKWSVWMHARQWERVGAGLGAGERVPHS